MDPDEIGTVHYVVSRMVSFEKPRTKKISTDNFTPRASRAYISKVPGQLHYCFLEKNYLNYGSTV